MKTTKRKSPSKPLPEKGASFIALPSQEIQRIDDGANSSSVEADFAATVAPFLLSGQYQNFSQSDALQLSRGQDLNPDAVKRHFAKWTEKLCRAGTIEKIPTVMDEDLFKVV